ncbi:putative cell wall biosynthetic ATPase [Tetragenococcus muriaticus PMC-11-5]|uniref:tRNA threonylcarbamoyladenosine biosynthesis protein TsaE n=1 Tax=Tetragenococcus muriaticus PMC-11-5 TaxID=1302649 RepID=A0A091C4U4_9ENTE|nr:tRNA (adenosine(37)-N6)-threonylcarbamoyltransferase complex ATPase subunit type 1 TsaE [Tetragenococcus muriaticus]KFN91894.1 putative cell wall biosynthetic ATPase [Tetragenococcus muriaticus PMC-11-5]
MIPLQNVNETKKFAIIIGKVAKAGDNLILTGDLGAGKTTLTKGIAEGMEIDQTVKSPTYTIIREYLDGRLPLYHMDVYRIETGAWDLGLDEYFEGEGLCVIEWGRQLQDVVPLDYLELVIEKDSEDENKRQVTLRDFGPYANVFKKRIEDGWEQYNE